MKALVGAFNQEKALVGDFSVIVQPVVESMDRFTTLILIYDCVQAPDMVKSSSGNLIEDVMAAPAGGPVTVYADSRDRVIPATFTPYCSMSQVSWHP